jgi:hypothetical protein
VVFYIDAEVKQTTGLKRVRVLGCAPGPAPFIDGAVNGGCLDAVDQLWADDMIRRGDSLGEHRGTTPYRKFMAAQSRPCRAPHGRAQNQRIRGA